MPRTDAISAYREEVAAHIVIAIYIDEIDFDSEIAQNYTIKYTIDDG